MGQDLITFSIDLTHWYRIRDQIKFNIEKNGQLFGETFDFTLNRKIKMIYVPKETSVMLI